MADFDVIAEDFDRYRALPAGVPSAIRDALWDALNRPSGARVLDLGAGTGRVGEAFVAAGDDYVAVDPSVGMLAQFARKAAIRGGPTPALVQADGRALPFSEGAFDAVLLVQVLSGSTGWRRLLSEARRVLRAGGGLALGRAAGPPDGVDSQMRAQLSLILAELGVNASRRGAQPEEARAWLAPSARRMTEVTAAGWESVRSPRDFLARHATGARFAALPQPIKDEALHQLAEWAIVTFGTLDTTFAESQTFLIDVFVF